MICCGIAHNNMIDCNCKTRGFIYLAKLLTYTQWYVNSTQHTINLFFANDTKKNMCKCIIMAWLWYDFYHSDTTAFYDCLCCHQPIKRLLSTFLHSVSLYYYLYLPLIAYPFLCANFNQQDSFDIIPAASHLQKRISNVTLFTPGNIMHSNLEINYVLYVNFAHLAAKKMHV